MKKSLSTSLVALVLMNVMGYYGLLVGLQHRHSSQITHRIDAGAYLESETITIKFATADRIAEKYQHGQTQVEHDGKVFRLIKQRLYKDTLHIVLMRDEVGTIIQHALSDYALTFSSQAVDDDDQHLIILPTLIRDYIRQDARDQKNNKRLITPVAKNPHSGVFIPTYYPSVVHPPERS